MDSPLPSLTIHHTELHVTTQRQGSEARRHREGCSTPLQTKGRQRWKPRVTCRAKCKQPGDRGGHWVGARRQHGVGPAGGLSGGRLRTGEACEWEEAESEGQLVGTQAPGRGCVGARACGSTCHTSQSPPAPRSREPGACGSACYLNRLITYYPVLRFGSQPGGHVPRTVGTVK